ncbi:MAG: VOC family protein [Acidimicrobiia bacterium]
MSRGQQSRLVIDHVIICVPDLDEAAERYRDRHGLDSVPGGRHVGLGTANRIVPLGSNYVELLSVVDETEAMGNMFGRWAIGTIHDNPWRPAALCLRTELIEGVAGPHELEIQEMSRARPDGTLLSWRMAGLHEALVRNVPFFIQWNVDVSELPGNSDLNTAGPIEEVHLAGSRGFFDSWIGEVGGIVVKGGRNGIERIVIRHPDRQIELS